MIGAEPLPNGNGWATHDEAEQEDDHERDDRVDDGLDDESAHLLPPPLAG